MPNTLSPEQQASMELFEEADWYLSVPHALEDLDLYYRTSSDGKVSFPALVEEFRNAE